MSRGFTLIELIVVIAIFSVVTSISLFNQGKLNSTILVTNLAYEIALAVREAQTYGVGVRADGTGGSFEGGYGISFDINRPNEIILFTDTIDSNHLVDEGEEVSTMLIQNQRGNKIVAICRGAVSNPKCMTGSEHNVTLLNIIFRRPNPEAVFLSSNGSGQTSDDAAGPAYIVVNTPAGNNCRVIIVEKTGQIRVDNGSSGLCDNGS
ncbi:MAG: prepilin-type N-terminal cleavage/methylation domain-containing protein [Patescibacteria group bacterium]